MTADYTRLSKYRLLARLGSGGMAEVYLVLAEGPGGFNKLQVIKLMRPDLTDQERPEFLEMFQDEARLAARLNHPNIVQSHEVGSDDGQPFIVMEYLDGQPLSRVQQRARRMGDEFPLEMELFVLCQVLEGLDYAHRLTNYDDTPLNIIHRDVSPQNVFITYAGQTKLVDFGVAKTLESSRTRAGVVKGKVAYMAPEQVLDAQIDHRADLFSVGVLLWEAIARRGMHADLSVYESLNRLVRGDFPKIRELVPTMPEELERIVTRALQVKPEDRYPDADTFRADLVSFLDGYRKVHGRAVGERVAQLFAQERSQINTVIRRAMVVGSTGPDLRPSDFRVTRSVPNFASSPSLSAAEPPTPATRIASSPSGAALVEHAGTGTHAAPRARRWWLPAVLAVVAGATMFATVLAGSLLSGADSHSLASPASGPPPLALMQLDIGAQPSHAIILLDGKAVGSNPYSGQHPRDGREHALQVTATGYEPQGRTLRFDRDLALQIQLAASASGRGAVGEAAAPPVTRPTTPRPASEGERARPSRVSRSEREAFRDLPPARRAEPTGPALDTSDPWESSQR